MTANLTWLADALRAEGCRVVEEGNWKARGRPGAFDPDGVLWHHTGSTSSASNPFPTKDVLINGRPDLAGPLCHVGIGYDGVCHVIAAGRANHAGACNGFGPFTSTRDGNDQLVGFEIDYDGTQAMTAAQEDAATRCSTAVLKRLGRDEGWAARHEETSTTGKWDTGGVTGDELRTMIGNRLAGKDADEMPNYVHLATADKALPAGWSGGIVWDDVIAGGDVIKPGGKGVRIGGHLYQATLLLSVDVAAGPDDTMGSRTYEVDTTTNATAETNDHLEHPLTAGWTAIQDTRAGQCNAGRDLRWQVSLPVAGTLKSADLVVFYW